MLHRGLSAVVLGIVLGWLPVAPVMVAAAPNTPPCSIASLTVWEDTSFTGDSKTFCYGTNVPDLRNIAHTQSGICSAFLKFDDNWNDCISSARYYENLTYGNPNVCLWINPNYGGSGVRFVSSGDSGSWGTGIYADSFSSLQWNC